MRDNPKINKGSSGQNRKASQAYLEKYRNKQDVHSSHTGLLHRVLEQSSGLKPTIMDSVTVNQRILNADGHIIADTYKTGMPDRFSLKEAIPGLQEGLQLMAEGSRYEFVIPPALAWGKKGVGNKIGPNAVLVVDIRLIAVEMA